MYDLIVVGAGPAGASAARRAAQHGLRTLLLEKERLPRNKLCGGGITPKVLTKLDFKLPNELIEYEAKALRFHLGERLHEFENGRTLLYLTTRSKFDLFLTEKAVEAGAELKDKNAVRSVDATGTHVDVSTSVENYCSKMVIGADGMGGPTARTSGLYEGWKPDQVAYAIESDVHLGEKRIREFVGDTSCFDLYFGVAAAGYGWVFPKRDHLTMGVGCRLSRLRDGPQLIDNFMKNVDGLEKSEVSKPQAHLIPLGGVTQVPAARDRILLAGDCAGFAEPLLGEGIYFSIWSGQIAADMAAKACELERFDREFLSEYEQKCEKAFGADFEIAYRIACLSYLEQDNMHQIAHFFLDNKMFQKCMVGLMEGSLNYRDVRAKLAWPYFKYRLARHEFSLHS
jgi:geranylgeranyl reductase family protein